MARIAGVNLPNQKRLEIGLTYIYGIGRSVARRICEETGVDVDTKTDILSEDDLQKLSVAGLDITEKTDLLEYIPIEILRLVHD